MRKLNYTTQFERDFKRVKRNPNHKNFEALLEDLVINLFDFDPVGKSCGTLLAPTAP